MSNILPIERSLLSWSHKLATTYSFMRFASNDSSDSSSNWKPCPKLQKMEENPPVCRSLKSMRPSYFQRPPNCKSDYELAKLDRSILGIPRCDPDFVMYKDCDSIEYDPCKLERMDDLHYKPSRSLDREFDRYWVECVYQRRPKRLCRRVAREICRRTGGRPGACRRIGNVSKCKVLLGMECKKMTETIGNPQCVKMPLCECAKASKNTQCRIMGKPGRCRRRLTRYPSFSECLHDGLTDIKLRTECRCMEGVTLCEMWKAFKNFRPNPCKVVGPDTSCQG